LKKFAAALAFLLTVSLSGVVLAAPLDNADKAGRVALTISSMWNKTKADGTANFGGDHAGVSGPIDFETGTKANLGLALDVSIAPKFIFSVDYMNNNNKGSDQINTTVDAGAVTGTPALNGIPASASLDYNPDIKLRIMNFKLKYQAYKDDHVFFAPYIGMASYRAKAEVNGAVLTATAEVPVYGTQSFTKSLGNQSASGNTKNKFIVGFTTVANLTKDKKAKVYLDAGVGNDIYSWDVGISYDIVKNLSFGLGYRYQKVKDISISHAGINPVLTTDASIKGLYVALTAHF
jgi:opacity protein-like surface antigen